MGAELGLAGVLALVAIVVVAVGSAARAARGYVHTPRGIMAVAAGVGIVAHVVTWLTGHPLLVREGQFTFWPLVACAVLLKHATLADGHRAAFAAPSVARAGAWVAAALIVALVPWRAIRDTRQLRLANLTFGMYDREIGADGQAYNWSTGRVAFFVPSTARVFSVPLRSLAPFPQEIRVLLDGVIVDRMALTDHAWRVARYILPSRRNAPPFYRVELHIEPAWTPAWDSRTLGVIVGEREFGR